MNRFAASALCATLLALVTGAVSAHATVVDGAPPPVLAVSEPEGRPVVQGAEKTARQAQAAPAQAAKHSKLAKHSKKAQKARHAKKFKHAKKARQLAARQAKARAKQRAALRAAKLAQRKASRASGPLTPVVFSPPAVTPQPTNSDTVQRWPARMVIGATVTAFSQQGDVGSARGFGNGQRAMARFHGGPEVSCQLMLMPRDREILPGSTGSALLRCHAPFQVLKEQPTFTLHQGGRLVGEGNLGVLSEP